MRNIIEVADPILIPQIQYSTNDSWELISGMDSGLGWPFLHQANFANGMLYMLTIPENFADLYNLPTEVLNKIREVACSSFGIELKGGSQISMFLYDNNTFVVHNFNDKPVEVEVLLSKKAKSVADLSSNKILEMKVVSPARNQRGKGVPEKYSYKIQLPTRSFGAFKIE
jgi:hypothetical protein